MKQHPFDILSFVAGTLFVALGIAFLATDGDIVDSAHWLWPVGLLTLGAAGLASTLRRD